MTLGQGQWPRVTGRTGVNQCALLLEKSVNGMGVLDYNKFRHRVNYDSSEGGTELEI